MKSNELVFKQCKTGQKMIFGKLRISVLSPWMVGQNNNNNSCVIHITDGYRSVLLTGDIDKHLEHQLIEENSRFIEPNQLKADILIAPHHGSKTSSSAAFIKQVDPRWVVFAAGYKNRWGFPKNEVVERYKKQGVIPFTTSKSGFIRFNVQNQHIEVKTYREDLAAYWYHRQIEF